MRLIDADKLLEELMNYVVGGSAENPADCAEINRMIKDAPTVDVCETMKKAVRKIDQYKLVDGYMYVLMYDVEKAIDATKAPIE